MIGRRIGSYQVKQRLGQGGVGSVYRVEHTVLGTMHALKVLTMPSERSRRRLLAEGQIQARLDHPNLVAVRDVVDVDGQPGLILDLVRGPTLARLLASGPLPADAIGPLGAGILRGMAKAHAAGLVHRDLKPANVLLHLTDEGEVIPKVADFGLAREAEGAGVTASGASLGTPRYMAPEQVRDPRDVDARSDVWALGVVLYELCCGRAPFEGDDDLLELYGAIAAGSFEPLSSRCPGLPEAWLEAVADALQVDRQARPTDAAALLARWEAGAVGGGIPEAVVATVQTLVPAQVDDEVPQDTWGGGATFDSLATPAAPAASPPAVGLQTFDAPPGPEAFHQPPAPLPDESRTDATSASPRELLAPFALGVAVVLVMALGTGVAVWGWSTPAPLEVHRPVPMEPVPVAPVPADVGVAPSGRSQKEGVLEAYQAFLDGNPVAASEQVHWFTAAAPTEDPQLLTIAAAAAEARRSSAWEEVERGRAFGLDPLQGQLADALGDPQHHDAAILDSGHEALIYARLRMGPRHGKRDAELLDALAAAAGPRRLVDLARAQTAMASGASEEARSHLDEALKGAQVPEWVHLTDALWHLQAGEVEAAAAIVDPWIEGVERPSSMAWMLRWELAERRGRSVQADEAAKRFRGPATVTAMRRWLRADRLLAEGAVSEGLQEVLDAEEGLHRYVKSREVNVVRLDALAEIARLGAAAGRRDVVTEALSRLKSVPADVLPPPRSGTLAVRIELVEALLVGLDGRSAAADALRQELERAPVTYAEELRILDQAEGPLRVDPGRFF